MKSAIELVVAVIAYGFLVGCILGGLIALSVFAWRLYSHTCIG